MRNCAKLALALNARYHSNATYDGISSVEDYLSDTGVLLSVCGDNNCTADDFGPARPFDHLSGSWLQESTTGPRIFQFGNIGMVLDPQQVDIECVYPLDGVTVGRDENGCGVLEDDPSPIPIRWFHKEFTKLELYWRKFTKFPLTKWEDIDCCELLLEEDGKEICNMVFGMVDHNQTWWTMGQLQKLWAERSIGHTVCRLEKKRSFVDQEMLAYIGQVPWMPWQWNDCMETTQSIIEEHPESGIWNEVVMKKITDISGYHDAIEAIFYIFDSNEGRSFNDNNWKTAKAEAKRLGVKNTLKLDPLEPHGKLFGCHGIFEDAGADLDEESIDIPDQIDIAILR